MSRAQGRPDLLGVLLLAAAAVPVSCEGEEPGSLPDKQFARFALSSPPTSLDPRHSGSTANLVLQRQIYETLTEYDYTARPLQIRPLLAESWEKSADGRNWVFTLRTDASFYDPEDPPLWPGRRRAMTANDVVYSWLLQADETRGSTAWFALKGLIAGLDEFHDVLEGETDVDMRERIWEHALANGVKGLVIRDSRTLEVQLQRPSTEFLPILATQFTAVVPREAVERHGLTEFGAHPVGSGPFHVDEWVPRSMLFVLRVPDWRGQESPFGEGDLPHLDGAAFTYVEDDGPREMMFRKGELDRLSPNPDSIGSVIQNGAPEPELAAAGVTLTEITVPNITHIGFNMLDPVVGTVPGDARGNENRRKLRHAIARAFPHDRWMRVMRSETGAAKARTMIPPGVPGLEGAEPWSACDTNLDEARRLLAEAGWPEGEGLPPLRFDLFGGSEDEMKGLSVFVNAVESLGIQCELVKNVGQGFTQKARNGEVQLFWRGWLIDWMDAGSVLQLFHSSNAAPGDGFYNYSNPEFDQAFDEYQSLELGPARTALLHRMLAMLHHDLPAIPLDHKKGYMLVHPWLKNYVANPLDPIVCKQYRIEGR